MAGDSIGEAPDSAGTGATGAESAAVVRESGAMPTGTATEDGDALYRVNTPDGEMEVTLDELLRGYGHTRFANQRFREASQIRKDAQEREALMQQIHEQGNRDYTGLLKYYGHDPVAVAESILQEHVRQLNSRRLEEEDPERAKAAREMRQMREENEKWKREHDEQVQREQLAARQQAYSTMRDSCIDVLDRIPAGAMREAMAPLVMETLREDAQLQKWNAERGPSRMDLDSVYRRALAWRSRLLGPEVAAEAKRQVRDAQRNVHPALVRRTGSRSNGQPVQRPESLADMKREIMSSINFPDARAGKSPMPRTWAQIKGGRK